MAQSMEQIRQKIKVVDVSYKITKAMQLVSTAKLKRVGKRIESIKPYYSEVYDTFNKILPNVDDSLYVKSFKPESKKTLWLVFNSNLGLCAGFNNNLNKLVYENLKPEDQIIAVGGKAVSYFTNHKKPILESYLEFNTESTYRDAQSLSLSILSRFNGEQFDTVKIGYTKYINSVTMTATIMDVLPIINEVRRVDGNIILTDFEPDAKTVIDTAIPLYLSAMVYGSLIESQVAEQASRRLAMENASNNASDMKNNLLVNYNTARQGAITQEISEIIGGADAQSSS